MLYALCFLAGFFTLPLLFFGFCLYWGYCEVSDEMAFTNASRSKSGPTK